MKNKVLWFINYGPDKTHLWETAVFYRLKDAKEFIDNLSLTPIGKPTPFKLLRAEYKSCNVYGDVVSFTDVMER